MQGGAQRVLRRRDLLDQKRPGRQQGPRLLGIERLDMHALEPAKADELRDPTGVVAIRLHPHRGKRGAHMPCLHHRDGEALLPQPLEQPLGQAAGLKAHMFDLAALMPDRPRDRVRLAGAPPLLHDAAALVDDTDMRAAS